MAFRHNSFSEKISNDPAAAHARLVELFEIFKGDRPAIAKHLDVTTVTLWRWVDRLVEQGYKNPGDDYPRLGGRPSAR